MAKRIDNKWLLLLKGVILLVLSFLIFKHTRESIMTVSVFMGTGLIVMGITLLIISIELKKQMERWNIRLAEGLVDIVFGFFLLAHPEVTLDTIPVFIGFWIIFYGILMLSGALDLPESHTIRRKIIITIAIVTIVLGFLVSFNPSIAVLTMGVLIGVPIFIIGLANIFFAFYMKTKLPSDEGVAETESTTTNQTT